MFYHELAYLADVRYGDAEALAAGKKMSKLKLYGLVLLGVVLGFFGLRHHWTRVAELKLERDKVLDQIDQSIHGKVVSDEIRSLDDTALRDAALEWVRGSRNR
jgi:hypothetical protein